MSLMYAFLEHGHGDSVAVTKGNCHDNAIMENFFGRLKTEMFYGHEYEFHDYDTFKTVLGEYILWWNEKRIQAKLNWLAPHEVLTNWNANVVR